MFESRLGLVTRQLARAPYLAGETFMAADISVNYALELARRIGLFALGEAARLCRLHARTRRLQARDGHLSGHEGMGRYSERRYPDRPIQVKFQFYSQSRGIGAIGRRGLSIHRVQNANLKPPLAIRDFAFRPLLGCP